MKQPYSDIINNPRHRSVHARMTNHIRAAQFAPFAALSGHSDMINEAARYTDRKILLDEYEKEQLDRTLSELVAVIENQPQITVTYFIPDAAKDGGKYITVDRRLKKIDNIKRKMIFTDGTEINADDVFNIDPVGRETDF